MTEIIERAQPGSPQLADEAARPGSPNGKLPNGPKPRRRTKTGCQTCRKRRIKCGEERPICGNCVKSKRTCEGYAPRLVFKNPVEAYPAGWPVRGYILPPNMSAQYMQSSLTAAGQPPFSLIAPRPTTEHVHFSDPFQTPQAHLEYPVSNFPSQGPYLMLPQDVALQPYQPQVSLPLDPQAQLPPGMIDPATSSYNLTEQQHQAIHHPPLFSEIQSDMPLPLPSDLGYLPVTSEHLQGLEAQPPVLTHSDPALDAQLLEARMLENLVSPTSYIPVISPTNGTYHVPNATDWQALLNGNEQLPAHLYAIPNYGSDHDPQSLTYYLQHPAVTQLYEEDEYYDVESDEEMLDIDSTGVKTVQKKQRDLSHVLAISGQGQNLRSVGAFLNKPDMLATYMPKFTSSPLMDEDTARIFCHFVTATGPLMSGYGRHPVNPALLFSGTPVPKSQQALWTYTLPMLAISNQGLLHAILAVASLNIARLEQAPLTVPTKHYEFALRRVAKAVATPGKRTSIATVAASILLSQFEVLSAEHSKWHSHLAGARQLFTEINFSSWTDKIYREKAQRNSMGYAETGLDTGWARRPPWSDELPWIPDHGSADEDFLHRLRGSSIKKPIHGRNRNAPACDPNKPMSEKEMDDFQTYRDLFWMYTKIDNIQSIVMGRRLLMPLDYWAHVPPRAPMDRFDAVYGTLDHLGILMGRVADFAGKDVARKRRAMKANGGIWIPPPGFFGPPNGMPSSGGPPPNMMPPGQGFPGNVGAGMMPPNGTPVQAMPPGFPHQIPTLPTQPLPHNVPQGMVPNSMPPQEVQSSPVTNFLPSQSSGAMPGSVHPMHAPNIVPSMSGPSNYATTGSHPTTSSTPNAPSPPSFSGLFPSTDQPTDMPAAFMQAPRDVFNHLAFQERDVELSEATIAAEAEWNHIQEAFDAFEHALGPAFMPLEAETGPMINTPFGPALQYRTFQIATCWLLFYMTRVIAIRTHPGMPAASMMAAGVAAAKTANYCNIIGRINCGLQVPAPSQPLNPIFGGAVAETMLPMFVAGVQYKDNTQRVATIERLQFIVDRVGHNSAAFIAAGLERIWIEMHKAGRGPPYSPSFKIEDEYGRDLTEVMQGQQHAPNGVHADTSGGFQGGQSTPNKSRPAVVLTNNTRTFAAGVMGLEDSFGNLSVGTEPI